MGTEPKRSREVGLRAGNCTTNIVPFDSEKRALTGRLSSKRDDLGGLLATQASSGHDKCDSGHPAMQKRKSSRFELLAARKSISRLPQRLSVRLRRLRLHGNDQSDRERARERLRDRQIGKGRAAVDVTVPSVSDLSFLVSQVESSDEESQVEGATGLRKLLQVEKEAPIEQVVRSGVVPRLVEFLDREENPRLQLEAGWAITNIASGTSSQTKEIVQAGGIEALSKLMESEDETVRDQAIWALGNIAGDCAVFRDKVLEAGALEKLVRDVMKPNHIAERSLENATWTMLNMIRSKPSPDFERVECAVERIAQLLYSKNLTILKDACWAAAALSETGHPRAIDVVIGADIVKSCVKIIQGICLLPHGFDLAAEIARMGDTAPEVPVSHVEDKVLTPALRTVGNACTGNDDETQAVIDAGAVEVLGKLATHRNKLIRKEACWTLSNITAGNTRQVQAVIDSGVFPVLVQVVMEDDVEVMKEAVWAVANATAGGSFAQVTALVHKHQLVMILADCLRLEMVDDYIILSVALEGLENIVKVFVAEKGKNSKAYRDFLKQVTASGLLDLMSTLRNHNSESIAASASRVYAVGQDLGWVSTSGTKKVP